ncbi:MAG: hypothetical protein AAFO88_11535 [Pseudomonadota bacterium]
MSAKSRHNLTQNLRSVDNDASQTVTSLIASWRATRTEIERIQSRQDELFFSEQANTEAFYQLDGRRDKLRLRAIELLESIRNSRARSLAEVYAKLALWRDVRYPDGPKPTQKNAIDQVSVSALEDLGRLIEKPDRVS